MAPTPVLVRTARPEDLAAVGLLAAQLVRLHHEWDAQRFLVQEPIAEGYAWWLGKELKNEKAVVLVAEDEHQAILGYAYGRLEGRDWNALLDDHGALHDIFVDPSARRRGVASALLNAMITQLEALGAPRIVLLTATLNREGQALFARAGFRSTMIEMTRERG